MKDAKIDDSAVIHCTTDIAFNPYDALECCEYCGKDGKEIAEEDGFYVHVYENEMSISTNISCFTCAGVNEDELILKINYCPMCGRKL